MKYTDEQRLQRVAGLARKLLDYLSDNSITENKIMDDETIRWTITTPLYNIGEHVYSLSDAFKVRHSEVPWMKIAGLRHRLVHDYENTNWSLICVILFDELPGLLSSVERIIKEENIR